MAPVTASTETFIERHSWKFLLFVSVCLGLFGIGDILQGMNADPAIAESLSGIRWQDLQVTYPKIANLIDAQVRSGGAQLVTLSILSIAACLYGYRRGERWSWYAFWAYPLFTLLAFVIFLTADRQPEFPPPPPMISAPVFFIITVLVLLLSYRKFFPRNP